MDVIPGVGDGAINNKTKVKIKRFSKMTFSLVEVRTTAVNILVYFLVLV